MKEEKDLRTHEGGKAKAITPELQLRRSVMSCMLWEDEFYEDGKTISQRIAEMIPQVNPVVVSNIAIAARRQMKLRKVPLFVAREMARRPTGDSLISDTLANIIERPDELTAFLGMYWQDKKQPLSKQVKLGLAKAFRKFDEYQLAKYNQDDAIKLRDVLFMCHAKPKDKEQEKLWKKLVDGNLKTPDTWEVNLSAGKDKKETWERLMKENKLGALALLKNLRNMNEVGVDNKLVSSYLSTVNTKWVLPFRFIAADRYAPNFEADIEKAMLKSFSDKEKFAGHTVLLVDVSGSMDRPLSGKSDMNKMDAACGLAMFLREQCGNVDIYTFSNDIKEIPVRHGFALRDAVTNSQPHRNTYLAKAIDNIIVKYKKDDKTIDRLVVITDEQAHDDLSQLKRFNHEQHPVSRAYMLNVASYQNGVGYGSFWTHLDGFSEAILDYMMEYEKL